MLTESSNINKPTWSRKLYSRQPFPDNYIDTSFLTQLRRNANVPVYRFVELVPIAGRVAFQLTVITAFVGLFLLLLLDENALPLNQLLMLSNASTVVAFGSWVAYMRSDLHTLKRQSRDEKRLRRRGVGSVLSGLIFTILVLLLSPILKTLTEDTSSDTIWACSSFLFFLSWMSADYTRNSLPLGALTRSYTSPFSLNCAILASIALASRLADVYQVYGLLSIALNTFAFLSVLNRIIFKFFGIIGEGFLTVSAIISTSALWFLLISPEITFLFLFSILLILFLAPLLYLNLQKYKK